MSLLEDVFLQDEANEAEELERVIEGDEFEERRRSDSDENSEKEDEAEEDKRRVDPTKATTVRVVKNPRFLLNPARLTGPRGIQVIPDHFKDFKFKGKGHEKEDLDLVLKRLEHWAYRLYPKFQFEDCLKKIETLGKKKPVAVHLHKIRSNQFLSEDTVVQKDSSDDETPMPVQEEDEFDKLLQQQIELARSTPVPSSAKKHIYDGSPKENRSTTIMMPKVTSSPSINDDQRERMLRSRRLAEERRLARLKNATNTSQLATDNSSQLVNIAMEPKVHSIQNTELNAEPHHGVSTDSAETTSVRKHNRLNVIDSSDDEIVETNVSTAVEVHRGIGNNANYTNNPRYIEKSAHADVNLDRILDIEGTELAQSPDEKEESSSANKKNCHEIETNSEKNTIEENFSPDNIISNEKSKIRTDITFENSMNTDICAVSKNIVDTSGEHEELKYDDSDMNIDINVNDTSNKNVEQTDKHIEHSAKIVNEKYKDTEENCKIEETDQITEESDKNTGETYKNTEKPYTNAEESAKDIEESDTDTEIVLDKQVLGENPDKLMLKEIFEAASIENKDAVVPEEIIDEVMDIDFTEDF